MFLLFFFFSSRRRHTRSKRDWSSDVCSSDLRAGRIVDDLGDPHIGVDDDDVARGDGHAVCAVDLADEARAVRLVAGVRSEERRVGKECRSRWSAYHEKKKGRVTEGDGTAQYV